MTAPSTGDLRYYTSKTLTDTDWKTNFDKIVDYLTNSATGYDVTFRNITLKGTVTLATGTNITTTGTVTAGAFVGDGSALTGIGINNKNWFYNGLGQVDTNSTDYALVKDVYGQSAISWYGMATGTAVSAGFFTTSNSGIGTAGYEMQFMNVTLTGSGALWLRQRIYSGDARKLIGATVSIQAKVKHDFGSDVNYVIYVNKADSPDDFTTVTAIGNSGNIAVHTGTETTIKYEGVALGNCTFGLEVQFKVVTGAITTRTFEFTELQLEISPTCTDFEQLPLAWDCLKNEVLQLTGNAFTVKQFTASSNCIETIGGINDFAGSITNMLNTPISKNNNTEYTAECDGFVVCSGKKTTGELVLNAHAESTPGAGYDVLHYIDIPSNTYGGSMIVVRKGCKYKINFASSPTETYIYYWPLGATSV